MANTLNGRTHVLGMLSASSMSIPDGTVDDDAVADDAAIAAEKVIHQTPVVVELFGPTTDVAAVSRVIHIAKEAGKVVAVEAIVQTPATGADRTVEVDVQKGNAGTAYATILTSTADFDNTAAARTPEAAAIATEDYADGDSLEIVVTVAGSAGAQAAGLCVVVWVREEPGT